MRTPFVLAAALIAAACASVIPADKAQISYRDAPSFPFVLLDFYSVELRPRGAPRNHRVPPGQQALYVEARKGPTGYFGNSGFLGKCYGTLQFEARAGREYVVEFVRNAGDEALQVTEAETGFVLDQVPCTPSR